MPVGEIVTIHLLGEAFIPEETPDFAKVSYNLYLGNERYLTVSRDAVKYMDRKVYGYG